MAAAVVYNTNQFADSAAGGTPDLQESADGATAKYVIAEVPTASVDDAGDVWVHFAVPEGRHLLAMAHTAEDLDAHATPTYDGDIVLRVYDSAGAATDTVLFNGGTAFQAAQATPVWTMLDNVKVTGSADGYGLICLKAVAGAATETAGDLGILLIYR